MHFKTVCAIIGIILLLCQIGFGERVEKPVLLVYEPQEALIKQWKKSDRFVFEDGSYDWRVPLSEHLRGDNPPDLITLNTRNAHYQTLIKENLLADLSQDGQVQAAFRRLRPTFQSMFRSPDGKIFGMPLLIGMNECAYWLPENWEAAGLSIQAAPDSFLALLDFLENYLRQPQAGFRILPESELAAGLTHARWLLNQLIQVWYAQAQYQAHPAQFDDPMFAALIARAANIGQTLDQYVWEKDAKPLFSCRYCRGVTLTGESVTLRNLIPACIDGTQEKLILFGATLIGVRAGSPWEKEAIPYAAQAEAAQPDWARVMLYADVSPDEWNAANPQYPITAAWLDSLETCGYTPFLSVRLHSGSDLDALYRDLLNGFLSADDFVRKLEILSRTPMAERNL
ncbi:MAG: hypothetical protein IJU12_04190 [Clostridia bacterium]|nr:hypothetical protein [Clostridia bacterium]